MQTAYDQSFFLFGELFAQFVFLRGVPHPIADEGLRSGVRHGLPWGVLRHMANSVLRVVKSAVQSYSEESENWKRDHCEVRQCWEFEDFLEAGVKIFDALSEVDEKYRGRVLAKKIAWDPEIQDVIKRAYGIFADACPPVLDKIKEFEDKFGKIEHAEQFRARCREAHGILTDDATFFGEGLVPLRDSALDALHEGDVIEYRAG